ncbi:2-C-methyl-D-erythritol 4-phosphate cytidylyltransferase [Bacteroidales bacterium OttesenSCG-928-M11]|nr:2-C-methyl-D-erythritol 4-phosphate cytidylyltransferase [Bacteroidales bacterium OttesenSCG-928-M11]
MKRSVIIVAGGKGLRMGSEIPKQFLLLKGKPVLAHTIEAFYCYDNSIKIILVLPEEQQSYWQQLQIKHGINTPHTVVSGGETRFHSVKNGLQHIDKNSFVAIHDGVRPLVSTQIIDDAFALANKAQAVYPAIPVTDTLRKGSFDNSVTVDRSQYHHVQTPQVFASSILLKAYEQKYSKFFTDDISVVENLGEVKPQAIPGDPSNIKITTPSDLIIAETLLKCRI